MKTHLKTQFLLPALVAGFGLIPAGRVTAQIYTNLHDFTAIVESYIVYTNGDGANPYGGLVLSGNTLYGTASDGGINGNGTVFRVNTDGSDFTNLHNFTAGIGYYPEITNSDGAYPSASLILSGNTLYGTTDYGGTNGFGTVFAVNTDGSGFTNLYNFVPYSYSEQDSGASKLILSGNTLYGTTEIGGSNSFGMVFAINTNGTGFRDLHGFGSSPSDGDYPYGGVVLSGNTLYGTTADGGYPSYGYGTVFAVNTDGSGYTNLYVFFGTSPEYTNGYNPIAGLVLSGNTLYGTTSSGGTNGFGTVFAVNTNGTGFAVLHNFAASDGYPTRSSLFSSGNTLYGTANEGGLGDGTVYVVNTDGSGFATVHRFNDTGNDAEYPYSSVILAGNTLYGTAEEGGSSDSGTVFSILLPTPELTIIPAGMNVILTWPTNALVFTLQSTTNLVPPTVWTTVSPPPYAVIYTNNVVTNTISGTEQFYRLSL